MASQSGLSESEFEVLKVLWDLGPSPVRAVNRELAARGRQWAYTTVSTLLLRLATKGYVASDSSAVPHVFHPTLSRDELVDRRLREAADELCDGDAVPLVLALVQKHRFKPEELARLQLLLDEAKAAEGEKSGEEDQRGKGKP
jgi:BlaI family transcriptional regulator, penicillinase repressor